MPLFPREIWTFSNFDGVVVVEYVLYYAVSAP